jgi:hypothetical protein
MSEKSNQLTSVSNYDVKRMVFGEPQMGSVPNSNPPIAYRRINISTKNSDGSIGDLILPTRRVFSFGVGENKNPESGKVNGHVLPLCLWNKGGSTAEEKAWTDTFDKIVEQCKNHLVENRDEIEQFNLELNDLKKFNPLYWKREKGKVVEGTGPTLYAKLISSKKNDKILSMFFDKNGGVIDPLALLGKYCYVNAAIKIESIFVGNKITLQVKVYEAEVELMETGMKPLIKRGPAKLMLGNSSLADLPTAAITTSTSSKNDIQDDIVEDENVEETKVVQAPPKAIKKVNKVALNAKRPN